MVLLWALAAMVLAACGGGGGEREFKSDDTPGADSAPSTASLVELTKSSPTITSDGRQVVRLFATVKSASNVALQGVSVSFRASGSGVTIARVGDWITDVNGQAQAVLSISDPQLRVITVTSAAQGIEASTDITVIGTSVALNGPSSIVLGEPTVFQVLVADASGTPIVGVPVAIAAPASGASLGSTVSDAQGRADVIVTPAALGDLTLSVRAAGATGTKIVQVRSTSVAFEAPPASSERRISPDAAPVWTPVQVRVLVAGAPVEAGTRVDFTTTRGQLDSSFALTDAAGRATVRIHSALAGRALITATAPDGTTATRELFFLGGAPAKIEVQAAPTTVGVNLPGNVPNSSQIVAIVRDAADNRVKGVRVDFSTVDPSAGAGLSSAYALTDEFGRASVSFYPGALPTGTNAIVVTGTIDCASVTCDPSVSPTAQARLTAAKRALQLRIGTGNEMRKVTDEDPGAAPVFNEMPYGLLVTDSAGNPVSGVTLSATVVGISYAKGFYLWNEFRQLWLQTNSNASSTVAVCMGEDINENLLLDAGEDTDGDGVLTPGSVAAAYFGPTGDTTTGTTNDKGSAVLRIRYPRDRGQWASVKLRVTGSIPDGTEGAEELSFRLPVLGADISDRNVAPPGATSPYGTGDCP